jgi:putative flippase GtrA
MNKNTALMIAGVIFGLISLIHLLRILLTVEITIAGYLIPIWVSWAGFIVAFILSLLMFMARRKMDR